MTFRFSFLFWMCVICAAALGLYMAKYRVQAIKEEVADVARQIAEEKQALHVLSAEWAYLCRPERLQALSEKYLALTPAVSGQVASLDALQSDAPPPAQAPASSIQPASAAAGLNPLPSLSLQGENADGR